MLTSGRTFSVRSSVSGLLIAAVLLVAGADTAFASFRFTVQADCPGDPRDPVLKGVSANLGASITSMNTHNSAFCLYPGDLIYGSVGSTGASQREQLEHWKDVTSHFTGTMYVTPGNRDVGLPPYLSLWQELFPDMPQNYPEEEIKPSGFYNYSEKCTSYYFDKENCRFIVVCSEWEDRFFDEINAAWLEDTLKASTDFEHVFVVSHIPSLRGEFEMLVDYGVDAFFCGDIHSYQVSQPYGPETTWKTIVGTGQSGSYLMVEVDGAYVEAEFYSKNGALLDSFVIAIPEPGTMALLAIGGVGVLLRRKREGTLKNQEV